MDIDKISQYFKLDHEVIETTGIGHGVVIKFKTFYLKIYDDINHGHYDIEEYNYTITTPVKKWEITYCKFKRFAESFKYNDFPSECIDAQHI